MRHLGLWALLLLSLPRVALATIPDPLFLETQPHAGLSTITGLGRPTDGSDRMFVLRKEGVVRIIEGGVLLPTPFFTFTPIHLNSECGLLGVTFDPNYSVNRYVYFFVTVSPSEQQIIRLTDVNNVGQDPVVIMPGLPTAGRNHDGGGLAFGKDGRLYWSIGDNGTFTGVDADLTSLASKVGRARRDGAVPADNPFVDGPGPNNDYVWARGFRNPFTLTFHPVSGRLMLNVVGSLYEQIFLPQAGDHGGWNTYENNQPAGFITPIVAYRTNGFDVRTITTLQRRSGVLEVTTAAGPNRFRRGMKITLAGVADPTMNGEVLVGDTPTPNRFQALQAGPDADSTGGTATTEGFGGAITGGTLYDSSAFLPAQRGAFFFGDFNSGQLMRTHFDAQGRVAGTAVFGTDFGANVDAEVGPNGNLWIADLGGRIFQIAPADGNPRLVVTPLHPWLVEGGQGAVSVRLTQDPGGPLQVMATVIGANNVEVPGPPLSFDSGNWERPQPLPILAHLDSDGASETATVSLVAQGMTDVSVVVAVRDELPELVVNPARVTVTEGSTVTFTVALAQAPDVNLEVEVVSTSTAVVVTSGGVLAFTPGDGTVGKRVGLSAPRDLDVQDAHHVLRLTSAARPEIILSVEVIDDRRGDPDAGLPEAGSPSADAAVIDAGAGELDLGSPPDSGTMPVADGGGEDVGAEVPAAEEGCGCRLGPPTTRPSLSTGLLVGLLVALLRPRRRAECRNRLSSSRG